MTDEKHLPVVAQQAGMREALEDIWALTASYSQYTLDHFARKVRAKVDAALAAQPPAAPVETDEIKQLRAAVEYWRLAAERREERRERTGMDIPEARTLDAPELPHCSAETGDLTDLVAILRGPDDLSRQERLDAADTIERLTEAAANLARQRVKGLLDEPQRGQEPEAWTKQQVENYFEDWPWFDTLEQSVQDEIVSDITKMVRSGDASTEARVDSSLTRPHQPSNQEK